MGTTQRLTVFLAFVVATLVIYAEGSRLFEAGGRRADVSWLPRPPPAVSTIYSIYTRSELPVPTSGLCERRPPVHLLCAAEELGCKVVIR